MYAYNAVRHSQQCMYTATMKLVRCLVFFIVQPQLYLTQVIHMSHVPPWMIIFQSIKNCVSLNGSIFPSTTKQSGLRSGLWEQRDGTTTPMSALASQLDNINCQIIYHQPEESLQLITLNISQLYYGFEIRRLSAHVCVCVLHIYNMLLCVFVHGVTKKAQTNTMDYC